MENIVKEILMSKTILVGDLERIANLVTNAVNKRVTFKVLDNFIAVKAGKTTKTSVETLFGIPKTKLTELQLSQLGIS